MAFSVTLDLRQDEELRTHIKDVIRGMVKSVVKEEIGGVLRELMEKTYGGTKLDNVVHAQVSHALTNTNGKPYSKIIETMEAEVKKEVAKMFIGYQQMFSGRQAVYGDAGIRKLEL
jgi:hypothetical protein